MTSMTSRKSSEITGSYAVMTSPPGDYKEPGEVMNGGGAPEVMKKRAGCQSRAPDGAGGAAAEVCDMPDTCVTYAGLGFVGALLLRPPHC